MLKSVLFFRGQKPVKGCIYILCRRCCIAAQGVGVNTECVHGLAVPHQRFYFTGGRGKREHDDYIHAYRFQLLTGLRPGELLGLRWADIRGGGILFDLQYTCQRL